MDALGKTRQQHRDGVREDAAKCSVNYSLAHGTRNAITAAVLCAVPHAATVTLSESIGVLTVKVRRKWWVRAATAIGIGPGSWNYINTIIVAREAALWEVAIGVCLTVEVI